jgi:hypothetical protein
MPRRQSPVPPLPWPIPAPRSSSRAGRRAAALHEGSPRSDLRRRRSRLESVRNRPGSGTRSAPTAGRSARGTGREAGSTAARLARHPAPQRAAGRHDQRAHLAERVSEVPTQGETLLESLEGGTLSPTAKRAQPSVSSADASSRDVTELAPHGDAFAEQGAALIGIALPTREPAGSRERGRTDRPLVLRTGECVGKSSSSFGEVGMRHPEPPQGTCELELSMRIVSACHWTATRKETRPPAPGRAARLR